MFNSSKISDSPRSNTTNLYNNANKTANGTMSFIQPKLTSTPLLKRDSIFATPPKHNILSSRRYSLSEIVTPPRSNRRDLTRIINTGPLLASTGYNVNVSTYEDTKSPGFASRIVQYNEETERDREKSLPPTHQAKYGSPGLFPVVHLFKKKLPVLEQKPRRVTIRIASPEYTRHHSQEYNRKLLEGIVKPNFSSPNKGSPFSPGGRSSPSTRSVLDALKEISRKRIHAHEDYDLNGDSGKRLRTMDDCETYKRLRDDDSPLEKSPSPTSKQTSKRVCMYDEYAASCSSMDFSFKKTEQSCAPKRKSISISTITENPKESKQVKLINAETQTATNETVEHKEPSRTTLNDEDNDITEVADESVQKNKSPLKIFDDAPLERIRKNRLAALMGSLTGKEPVLVPKPDYATMLNSHTVKAPSTTTLEVVKSSEAPLVSILSSSPRKVSPIKSNKHVHFSVPESTSQTDLGSTSFSSLNAISSSTAMPILVSSAGESKLVSGATPETPAPPSSPEILQPSASDVALPNITFGDTGSIFSSTTSIVSRESSTSLVPPEAPKSGFTIPHFQFKSPISPAASNVPVAKTPPVASPTATSIPSAPSSTPPKMGGFKFNLSKPVATPPASTSDSVPTFSLGGPLVSNASTTVSDPRSTALTNTQAGAPGMFSFGAKTTTPASTTAGSGFTMGNAFGTASTISLSPVSSSATVASVPAFKFGPASTGSKPNTSSGSGFPLAQSSALSFGVASVTTSAPTFGTNTSTPLQMASVPAIAAPAYGTTKTQFFSFGAPASSGFGAPVSSTASALNFAAPTTTSSGFGVTSIAPIGSFLNTPSSFVPTTTASSTFLPPTTSNAGFGSNATSSAGFGQNVTSNTGFGQNATSNAGFGQNATSNAGFGQNATSNADFGSNATSNAGFGSNSAPMFGASKAIAPFGIGASTAPAFGTPSTAIAAPFSTSVVPHPQFGQSTTQSSFGTPTTTAAFGIGNTFGATTKTASSSAFGGSSAQSSVFGAKTGGFGTATNSTNIFGGVPTASTQSPAFGAPAPVSKAPFGPVTTAPSFGTHAATSVAPSFGGGGTPSFNFVAKTTAGTTFGVANSFGATTTASSGFGNSAPPAYGSSNSFGNSTGFGGGGGTFGGSNNPAFGVTTTSNNFASSNTSTFGTATGFNAADKAPAFGGPQATFGSNTATAFGGAPTNSGFGTPNAGFGTSTAVSAFAKPQPTQNTFGTPTSNAFAANNSFGTSQSFGATNPPGTQNAVFSFGAASPPKPSGVFSFGTGASNEVPKPSFNFTGGNTAVPAFGSGAPPGFGAGITQFNAPQPNAQGMFSIGSGSSSGKARTHLKPKRRT